MSRPLVPCDLCNHPCPKYHDQDEGGVREAVFVDCEHCGRYYIAGQASTTLESLGRYQRMDTRERLRQWVRGMGGMGRITTDALAKVRSKLDGIPEGCGDRLATRGILEMGVSPIPRRARLMHTRSGARLGSPTRAASPGMDGRPGWNKHATGTQIRDEQRPLIAKPGPDYCQG